MRRPTPRVQNLVSQCIKGLHEFGNTGQYRKRPIIVTVDWWASFERLNLSYFPDRYKLTTAKGFIEKVSHTVTLTLRKSCHIPCFGLIELLKGFKKLRVHYLLYVLMSEETASGAVSDARSWRLANKINAMEVKKNYVLCCSMFYVVSHLRLVKCVTHQHFFRILFYFSAFNSFTTVTKMGNTDADHL